MSANVRLENPGEYQGTFALLVDAAVVDMLSDGPFEVEYTIKDSADHVVRTNIVRYEQGRIFTSGGGSISVADIASLHF